MRASKLKVFQKRLEDKRRELLSGVRERSASTMEAAGGTLDIADQAAHAYTKEFLLSLGDVERRLLRLVDAALDKIKQKNYGKCEKCGEEIGEKRLEALPFARHCVPCQEEEEENQ
ncbi:MAG: TraR/DksA family transcriptional regulator [Candidatus Methylomirabilales bacterium]